MTKKNCPNINHWADPSQLMYAWEWFTQPLPDRMFSTDELDDQAAIKKLSRCTFAPSLSHLLRTNECISPFAIRRLKARGMVELILGDKDIFVSLKDGVAA